MTTDRVLRHIELLQGEVGWGETLDAGTGMKTLPWLAKLPTRTWTAVTKEPAVQRQLAELVPRRADDQVILGDWTDPGLLLGRVFDVVIADTLLPALEASSPFFQDRLFERIRPHVRGRLYVVGLEPWPDRGETAAEDLVLEAVRLRDATLQLTGNRPYRDYPMGWVARHLDKLGFNIMEAKAFPITHNARSIERVLAVVADVATRIPDPGASQAMEQYAAALAKRASWVHDQQGTFKFGQHYLIAARRP